MGMWAINNGEAVIASKTQWSEAIHRAARRVDNWIASGFAFAMTASPLLLRNKQGK